MTERMTPALTQFNAGELAAWLLGRTDLAYYPQGLRRALNWILAPHGPAIRRPGGRYVASSKSNQFVVLRRLSFAPGIAYVIEFGNLYARFFDVNRQPVLDGGSPFELVTPWGTAVLRELRFQGSANVLWVFHGLFAPQVIKRLTATTFGISAMNFGDGPYYPENITAVTMTLGALNAAGLYATTLTASAATFAATDVGRHVRLKAGPSTFQDGWVWMAITGFTSSTVVDVFVHNGTTVGTPLVAWRLGLYNSATGWPSVGVIHKERMTLGSEVVGSFPRIDGSIPGNFEVFRPGGLDGDAVQYILGADEVPSIRDLKSLNALLALTVGAPFRIAPDGRYEPLTPGNAQAEPISDEGAANFASVRAGEAVVFVDEFGQAVHEISWTEVDSLRVRELSVRSAHLGLDSPFIELAWARKPFNQLLAPREDGTVAACTFQPEQDVIAWGPWQLGEGAVESVTTLRAGRGMEIWLSVRRTTPAGATVRHIEVIAPPLRDVEPAHDAVHLDAAVMMRDTPAAILTLTATAGNGDQTFSASASVFGAGDVGKTLRAWAITGRDRRHNMPEWTVTAGEIISQGGNSVVVRPAGGKALPALIPANYWGRASITTVVAAHLASRTVHVWADAADVEAVALDGDGEAALAVPACVAVIGIPYNSDLQPMPPEPPTRKGSATGKQSRVAKYKVRLVRAGRVFSQRWNGTWEPLATRTAPMPMDVPPPLYTGDAQLDADLPSEPPVAPILRATGGAPCTIASLAPDVSTGEGT